MVLEIKIYIPVWQRWKLLFVFLFGRMIISSDRIIEITDEGEIFDGRSN